ncbi:MAG: hypothetical protein HOV81_44080 [Kofleriaceae bacterium]|nr:hypothetical protein [Kofleriaceae bacterium]
MPRFVAIATKRISLALELATKRTPDSVTAIARELHAIAGEAGLLGLEAIEAHARTGEGLAKKVRTSRSDADADALLASLTELKGAIDRVAPTSATSG